MGALQTSFANTTVAIAGAQFRPRSRSRQLNGSVSRTRGALAFQSKPAAPVTMKEWDLVKQANAGNAEAQEQLFKTYTPRLYRMAFSVLRNKQDAEDAVQESWCKAYRNLDSFEGRSAFSTWLTRIAINSALMQRRSKRRHPEASFEEILDTHPEPSVDRTAAEPLTPEDVCLRTEIGTLIHAHVGELPPKIQAAFRLHEIQGLSTTESVRALGIHRSAFKSRLSRARRKLAAALKKSIRTPAQTRSVVSAGPWLADATE